MDNEITRFKKNGNDKVIGYIFESSDYDKFVLDKLNRPVSRSAVNKLVEAVKNGEAKLQPIEVSQDYVIIDGQHRFSALKKLGLPVAYYVDNQININDAAMQNSKQKHWTTSDYIRFYMLSGNSEYMKLFQVLNEYKSYITTSAIFAIGSNRRINGDVNKAVKQGQYKMSNYNNAIKFFNYVKNIKQNAHLKSPLKQAVAQAVFALWSRDDVDIKRLQTILNKDFILRLPSDRDVALQMITDEYNKRLRIKIKYLIANGTFKFADEVE